MCSSDLHIYTFEPDGYLCDVADSRTALERFEQGAGLVVDRSEERRVGKECRYRW